MIADGPAGVQQPVQRPAETVPSISITRVSSEGKVHMGLRKYLGISNYDDYFGRGTARGTGTCLFNRQSLLNRTTRTEFRAPLNSAGQASS
jgi:hypothetical protein